MTCIRNYMYAHCILYIYIHVYNIDIDLDNVPYIPAGL